MACLLAANSITWMKGRWQRQYAAEARFPDLKSSLPSAACSKVPEAAVFLAIGKCDANGAATLGGYLAAVAGLFLLRIEVEALWNSHEARNLDIRALRRHRRDRAGKALGLPVEYQVTEAVHAACRAGVAALG